MANIGNRYKLRIILITLFMFFISPLFGDNSSHVLFISSYHPGFSTFFQQIEGIKSQFSGKNILLDIEFMDTKRFPGEKNLEYFNNYLHFKLNNTDPYDLIITGDDNAFKYAKSEAESLFSHIPVVFLGVNDVDSALEMNRVPGITGIVEHVSMKETIQLMIDQNPKCRNITALVDGTTSGLGDLKTFQRMSSLFPTIQFNVIDLRMVSWEELSILLQNLDSKCSLLLLSAYFDKNNDVKEFEESLGLIVSSLTIPLYHLWYHGIGEGILGGHVISHYGQGRSAAEIALKVLNGKPISEIEVIQNSPNQFVFDYNQIIRFKIPSKAIPPGSLILNKPQTFYDNYKREIWVVFLFVLFLVVTLLFLLVNLLRRIKAEKSLKILEKAVGQSPVSIVITNTKGEIEYVNDYFCRLTGYSREEVIGAKPSILRNRELNNTDFKQLWEKISSGKEWEGRFFNKKKNGTPFCESALITPVFNNKGVIEHYIALKEDITEKMERDELNARLLAAIEQLEDTVEIFDSDKRTIYVNSSFLKKHGFSKDQVIGKTALEIFKNNSRENLEKGAAVWKTVDSGKEWRGQFHNKNADGSELIQDVSITPVLDESGKIISYASVKKDISRWVKLVEEHNRIQENLFKIQKMESVGQLASGIAHDFNDILSGIMTASQMILMPKRNIDDQTRKYAKMIFSSCENGADLTTKLLNFSQSNRSTIKPTDIKKIVEETVDILKHTIKKNIEFTISNHLERESINCDASAVQSALLNLGINSGQAIEIKGRIDFIISRKDLDEQYCRESDYDIMPGGFCSISVIDTGKGIPSEIRDHIFEEFFTTRAKGEGTGLGLSSVRRIICDHRGCIEVTSQEGKGTRFDLMIPLNLSKEIHQ